MTTALFALTREYHLVGGTLVYAVMISLSVVAVALSGILIVEQVQEE